MLDQPNQPFNDLHSGLSVAGRWSAASVCICRSSAELQPIGCATYQIWGQRCNDVSRRGFFQSEVNDKNIKMNLSLNNA
jgi:hypothetical protein